MKKFIMPFLGILVLLGVVLVYCTFMHIEKEPTDDPEVGNTMGFSKQYWHTYEGDTLTSTLPYWLHIPELTTENTPLLVVLHCSNLKSEPEFSVEQNLDNMVKAENKDIPSYLYNGTMGNVPAYIIMPQTDDSSRGWARMGEELIGLIDFCKDGFDIKDDRISLIGYSMGGTGAIELAAAYPSVFSKVVAIGAGIDGITNSTRPYIQNVGDYELRDDIYASLRVVKKNNSDQYEPDTMKYLYAPEENRYRAVTNNEILQAEEFKKSRIAAIAEALKNSNTKFWIISGGKDIEIDISIPTSLCGYFDEDKVKFEIKEELSHAKLVEACPEMRDKLWSFLVG